MYLFNIDKSLCPDIELTSIMFKPFSKRLDTPSCLRSCNLKFSIPRDLHKEINLSVKYSLLYFNNESDFDSSIK